VVRYAALTDVHRTGLLNVKETLYRNTTCTSLGNISDSWVNAGTGFRMSYKFPSIRIESSFETPPGAGEVVREGPREDGRDDGTEFDPARDTGREPNNGISVGFECVCVCKVR